MAEEDVDTAILRPMRALYPPPRHLRADEDAHDAALGAYRRALARFDEAVLHRAWQRVVERHDYWCWPKLPDLVRAAEQARRELLLPHDETWVEQATRLSDAYTRRFLKTSAHAARAREGGYEPQLKEYVWAAAWVQAQYIAGRAGVGYDHRVLFGKGPRDPDAEEAFFASARAQAESGDVRVRLPRAVLDRWQGQAEPRGRGR